MARSKELDENAQSVNWKLLLYPDNEVHNAVIGKIMSDFYDSSIWITHKNYNPDGSPILEGQGKPHMHFAMAFDKRFRCGSLCKFLGLVDSDSGLPDSRFCRPVKGRLSQWLIYLTHLSEPDKEKYSVCDLRGSPALIRMYEDAALSYQGKECSAREAVACCIQWINSPDNADKVISTRKFAQWLLASPYFKARNDRLVIGCLQEHNALVYDSYRSTHLQQISDSQERYQLTLRRASGGGYDGDPLTLDFDSENLDDWKPLF